MIEKVFLGSGKGLRSQKIGKFNGIIDFWFERWLFEKKRDFLMMKFFCIPSCARYYVKNRVSIQGVKSLWGERVVFPRLGNGTPLFTRHLSASPVPNLAKTSRSPQSDLTPWISTLKRILVALKTSSRYWKINIQVNSLHQIYIKTGLRTK